MFALDRGSIVGLPYPLLLPSLKPGCTPCYRLQWFLQFFVVSNPSNRANVISNIAGTLPRGQKAQEANVAHTGVLRTASYRGGFSEGHVITRDQAVTEHNLGGAQVGSGRIINRSGITNPKLNGDQRSGVSNSRHIFVDRSRQTGIVFTFSVAAYILFKSSIYVDKWKFP